MTNDAVLIPVSSIESGDWPDEATLEALVISVLRAVEAELGLSPEKPSEVSLLFTDDETIRGINAKWRGKDKPTNVLSFPSLQLKPGMAPGPLLGDIVFGYDTVAREAADEGKPFEHHLSHLVTHGLLHLFGYDHETEADAQDMEAMERRILASLAIPDPYAVSDDDNV